ncbi:hypothetical protein QTP86_002842, partial [Hemibagrus guttatus]
DHYTQCIAQEVEELAKIMLKEWEPAFDIAVRWYKNRFGKRHLIEAIEEVKTRLLILANKTHTTLEFMEVTPQVEEATETNVSPPTTRNWHSPPSDPNTPPLPPNPQSPTTLPPPPEPRPPTPLPQRTPKQPRESPQTPKPQTPNPVVVDPDDIPDLFTIHTFSTTEVTVETSTPRITRPPKDITQDMTTHVVMVHPEIPNPQLNQLAQGSPQTVTTGDTTEYALITSVAGDTLPGLSGWDPLDSELREGDAGPLVPAPKLQSPVNPSGGQKRGLEVVNLFSHFRPTEDQYRVLSKGLTFVPTPRVNLGMKKQLLLEMQPADKGSAVVIMDRAAYVREAHRQLHQPQYYQKLDQPLSDTTGPEVRKILTKLKEKGFINRRQLIYLIGPDSPCQCHFYLLPKIHKDPQTWSVPFQMPPGRPIVSDCGSDTYATAEYIEYFLNPLSNRHPSYVRDTYDFLDRIRTIDLPEHCFLFTIDVDSLYTNIDTTAGLTAVKEWFDRYPDKHRPDQHLLDLLKINLIQNDFEFNSEYFLQIKGTAMGKKFAPSYANIFMAKWEEGALATWPVKPLHYYRFLDDIWGVWAESELEFQKFVNHLNQFDHSIKVKHTLHPSEVTFLDTVTYKGGDFPKTHRLQNTPHNILPVFNYSDVLLDIVVGGAVALFKCFKKRKRGKRAGALVKLRQRGFRTVLPSIHLANLRSLPNKMDELLLLSRTNKDFSNSAALCFTESWLNDAIPDSALNLPGFQLFRADRVAESAGKSRGGGTCFYINERWCTDVTVLKKMCCPDLEAFFINCKPFYSPREFSSFILVSVYIPPQAHVSSALQHLADEITHTEQQHPDSVIIILGDFNKANLSHELPKFKQHISCPTRDKNILDHCYTTIKDAYRSVPRAALGLSDHCLVHLLPTYRPKLKSAKP